MNKFRISLFAILLFLPIYSISQEPTNSKLELNTVYNEEYENSTENYTGELKENAYSIIRKKIESALSTKIPEENSILIHFTQNGRNCVEMNNNGKKYLKFLKNRTKNSSKISSEYQVSDFFVFAKDAFFLEQVEMKHNYVIDTGFFYENVFDIHENCSAFFLLKPNGKFMKYYGSDYFSWIWNFLEIVD
tara:strand:- start:718 stop:1287 length:570 start_codon:yes stop_codon:yes gene_type:complete